MRPNPETLAVVALALGQLLTYAGVYYAFPALLPDLLAETGWSEGQLAAGPTLSFLVMAAATPLTGRLVDRGWGGEMLAFLPVAAAIPLSLVGFVRDHTAYLGLWGLIGLLQAGMLYETCFAFLTRRLGGGARWAISLVTLVAGFSSTVTFPLGHALGAAYGAAVSFAVFAALIPLTVLPLNLWAVRRLRRLARATDAPASPRPDAAPARPISTAMRRAEFWLLAGMFGLIWLNHAILITFALLLFRDRGLDPGTAALAASCIGPAQVAGRLVLVAGAARVANSLALRVAVLAVVLAALALAAAQGVTALVFLFAALQGAGVGVLSILRPVMIAERLGPSGFGAVSGAIAISPILATALGPMIGAALLSWGGADGAILAALALAVAGAATGLALSLRRA